MRKYILFCAAVLVTMGGLITASCKKIIHSNAPTPNNLRMVGYNKITTFITNVPVALVDAKITESFRFYYDDVNRVRQIVYTGNDSNAIHKIINFTYSSDTIYKSITNVLTGKVVELDTFIKNSDGLIVTAYTTGAHNIGVKNTFEYYGKLLSRINKTALDSTRNYISANSEVIYTSVDGDWLKQYPKGKLDVEFFNLTPGLDVDWIETFFRFGHEEDIFNGTYTFNAYNYKLPLSIFVQDTLQDTALLVYPEWDWVNESYHFHTEDANRLGDYMQLQSFTMYGQNIYNNKHLVESIAATNKNAYITYKIDAESKITQTQVKTTDSLLNNYTYIYDIQYETY
jgi:hypothetical protein